MARGKEIDRATAELILKMKEQNPKLTTQQIAAVIPCDPTTAARIIKGGSWEGYCDYKKEKARKTAERKRKNAETAQPAEEQVPGQMEMELTMAPAPKPVEEIQIDQVKMMRFLAGQMDKICERMDDQVVMVNMKLDQLNDTMSMILRCIRRE